MMKPRTLLAILSLVAVLFAARLVSDFCIDKGRDDIFFNLVVLALDAFAISKVWKLRKLPRI